MPNKERFIFQRSVLFAFSFTMVLWLVRAIEWGTTSNFGIFGILPRDVSGMLGILTGPLIHGTFLHLLSNTFPLVFLLIAVFYFYDKIALEVFAWIYLITGFWVWIAAREAYHIGASGLVYGLAAFLFFSGIFRRDARSVAVAVAIAFLYNGMMQGILPGADPNISWESHLMGSAAGVFCSFYFRKVNRSGVVSVMGTAEPMSDSSVDSTFGEYTFQTSEPPTTYQFYSGEGSGEGDSPFAKYTYQKKR